MNLSHVEASLRGWEDFYIHKHGSETEITYVGDLPTV